MIWYLTARYRACPKSIAHIHACPWIRHLSRVHVQLSLARDPG